MLPSRGPHVAAQYQFDAEHLEETNQIEKREAGAAIREPWSAEEHQTFLRTIARLWGRSPPCPPSDSDWVQIAEYLPTRTPSEVQLHYNVYELFWRGPARRALQTRSLPNPTVGLASTWSIEHTQILEHDVMHWVKEQLHPGSRSNLTPRQALIQFCISKAREWPHASARQVAQQVTQIMLRRGISLPDEPEEYDYEEQPLSSVRGGSSGRRGLRASAPHRGLRGRGRGMTRRAESSGSTFPRAEEMQFELPPPQQRSFSASALGEMQDWVPSSVSAAPVSEWGNSSFPAFPLGTWPSREEEERNTLPSTESSASSLLTRAPMLLGQIPFAPSPSLRKEEGDTEATSLDTPSFDSMSSSFSLWDE